MSLPNNTKSEIPVFAEYIFPDNQSYSALNKTEYGGVDIKNTSQGNTSYVWRIQYINNNIVVFREGGGPQYTILSNILNVTHVDLAFDQSMSYVISYQTNNNSFLYWFDTVTQAYTLTEYLNARTPCLCLDDKRPLMVLSSDVLLAYIKTTGELCCREQRDRYTIEYILETNIPPTVNLLNIGMTANNRIKFNIAREVFVPLCEVNPP